MNKDEDPIDFINKVIDDAAKEMDNKEFRDSINFINKILDDAANAPEEVVSHYNFALPARKTTDYENFADVCKLCDHRGKIIKAQSEILAKSKIVLDKGMALLSKCGQGQKEIDAIDEMKGVYSEIEKVEDMIKRYFNRYRQNTTRRI